MIDRMFDSGSLPLLQRVAQFTGQRQRILADNVANLSTPHFKARDVDPRAFQDSLRQAVEKRRARATTGGAEGPLELESNSQMVFKSDTIELKPAESNQGILFHDRNNRDLERTMAQIAENTMAHNTAIDLMRSEFQLLQSAIRERA